MVHLKPQGSLRERALALLARREHSRAELAAKLARHAADPGDIEAVIDDLARAKLLSEERFAEMRVHVLARKFGAARIEHELKRQGLDAELIAAATAPVRETELVRARAAWSKRFGVLAASTKERAQQMRFLQSRGFSADSIRAIMRGTDPDADR